MTTPENCPKCGAKTFYYSTVCQEFQCLTLTFDGGKVLYEGNQCLKTQRDQLASQVAELTSALEICLNKLEAVSIHTCPEAIAILEKHKPTKCPRGGEKNAPQLNDDGLNVEIFQLHAADRELIDDFGRFLEGVDRINGVALFKDPTFAKIRSIPDKHKPTP